MEVKNLSVIQDMGYGHKLTITIIGLERLLWSVRSGTNKIVNSGCWDINKPESNEPRGINDEALLGVASLLGKFGGDKVDNGALNVAGFEVPFSFREFMDCIDVIPDVDTKQVAEYLARTIWVQVNDNSTPKVN